jgi:pilus assembly protein CpaB
MERKKALIWLILGAILSIGAGWLTYRTISRAQSVTPTTPVTDTTAVLVVVHDIPARAMLKEGDVAVEEVPAGMVPAGAVRSLDEAVGKIARVQLIPGEILVSERLVEPAATGKDVAFTMPEDYVIVALPATDLLSQSNILRPGDKVDILVSVDTGGNAAGAHMVTLDSLQNVVIQGILASKTLDVKSGTFGSKSTSEKTSIQVSPPDGLLIAVSPQDALVLKYFKDSGGTFDLALRSPTHAKATETSPVDLEYLSDRYQFTLPETTSSTSEASSLTQGIQQASTSTGGK